MSFLSRIGHPFLLAVEPERAHRLALRALASGLVPKQGPDPEILRTRVFGIDFANPFGTAAGFDKHAEVADAVIAAGFGFAEVGGVTPLPQPGNPAPRVFRSIRDRAVINRLGFNSEGLDVVAKRLAARQGTGPVGVNLGANKDSADRAGDFARLVDALAPHTDFLTVNVSSPNTEGLRDLQRGGALADLLAGVLEARARSGARPALLVKIAPDLDEAGFEALARVVGEAGIDGLVVSNTTLSREGLKDARFAAEAGGLSGAPLFARSTALLARARLALGPEMPLIGVGGVSSGADAYAKIRAGASLVQLYTGLIYEGMGLVGRMKSDLAENLARDGFSSVSQAVGADARSWAAQCEWA